VSIDGREDASFSALVKRELPIVRRPDPLGPWALDYDRLVELADQQELGYRAATPFPHVVLDNAFPDALLDELVSDFPSPDDAAWQDEDSRMQLKQQWRDPNRLPPVAAAFIAMMNAAPFLSFLERLTGIDGLIGDPHCHHGGLHQTSSGGFLKVHEDQIVQPALRLQRRINVIVYLNRGWQPEWGGELELWDRAMSRCCTRIEPRFNRVVVFDTVGSNHGHPDPAAVPPGVVRRSAALYYYVSPAHPSASSTDGGREAVLHARPGEQLAPATARSRPQGMRRLVPSVVKRRLRHR
jgi:2OG-Fe(II) oxygenase superfamily